MWALLPSLGSGSWWVMIRGPFGNGYKGAQSASEVMLVLGSVSVALVQVLTPVTLGGDSIVLRIIGDGDDMPGADCRGLPEN